MMYPFTLKGLDEFSGILYKGDKFWTSYLLSCTAFPSEKGSTLNCCLGSKFFLFSLDPSSEGGKNNFNVYPCTLSK